MRIAAVREANSTGNSTIQPGKPFRMYIIDSLFGFIGKAKLANNYYNREGVYNLHIPVPPVRDEEGLLSLKLYMCF